MPQIQFNEETVESYRKAYMFFDDYYLKQTIKVFKYLETDCQYRADVFEALKRALKIKDLLEIKD